VRCSCASAGTEIGLLECLLLFYSFSKMPCQPVNSVMAGFFTAVTNLLNADAVRKAVADSVPKSLLDLNLKAFEKGLQYGAIVVSAPASFADAELQMEYALG
jgi:hypothetical protein